MYNYDLRLPTCESSDALGFGKTRECEKYGAFWYPICPENFYNVACCICRAKCPEGYTDTGIGCTKPRYSRGGGTNTSTNLGYYVEIFIVIIAIVIIFMVIAVVFSKKIKITNQSYQESYYPQY